MYKKSSNFFREIYFPKQLLQDVQTPVSFQTTICLILNSINKQTLPMYLTSIFDM
jgi:hypothetical protein